VAIWDVVAVVEVQVRIKVEVVAEVALCFVFDCLPLMRVMGVAMRVVVVWKSF
jgi:hypothetical protein